MKRLLTAVARLMIFAFALQTLGCAYTKQHTSDMLHVQTSDKIHVLSLDPKARLYVDGQLIGTGAGTTTVKRGQTYTIAAKKDGCATAMQDTGSKFAKSSLLGFVNDAPLIAILADSMGVTVPTGQTSPKTYTVTPICPPAASPALS